MIGFYCEYYILSKGEGHICKLLIIGKNDRGLYSSNSLIFSPAPPFFALIFFPTFERAFTSPEERKMRVHVTRGEKNTSL